MVGADDTTAGMKPGTGFEGEKAITINNTESESTNTPRRARNQRRPRVLILHITGTLLALLGVLTLLHRTDVRRPWGCHSGTTTASTASNSSPSQQPHELQSIALPSSLVVLDTHNDLPYHIRAVYHNQINLDNFTFTSHLPNFHTDLPRIRKGRLGVQFWSAYVGCPKSDFDRDGKQFGDEVYLGIVRDTFQQVDLVRRLVGRYEQDGLVLVGEVGEVAEGLGLVWDDEGLGEWVEKVEEVEEAQDGRNRFVGSANGEVLESENDFSSVSHANPNLNLNLITEGVYTGKIFSAIGVEGLHQIGNSAAVLRAYYDLGVRYITLTHACDNAYADGAKFYGGGGGEGGKWGGLSERGRRIVREMNRIGMMVDLSHVTSDVMRDVLTNGTVKAPVMFSHSSVYSLCPHPRNVPDDVLHLVKENGGVVMINFYPRFISCGDGRKPEDATLEMVADHVEYIGNLIGWDHVGIGSDFDGIEMVPKGLEDVSKYPDLFRELVRRGVGRRELEKVASRNLLRVWKRVEEVRDGEEMRALDPLEDEGSVDVEEF